MYIHQNSYNKTDSKKKEINPQEQLEIFTLSQELRSPKPKHMNRGKNYIFKSE